MSKMSSFAGKRADADYYFVCMDLLLDTVTEVNLSIEQKRKPLRPMEDRGFSRRPASPFSILPGLVDDRLQSIC